VQFCRIEDQNMLFDLPVCANDAEASPGGACLLVGSFRFVFRDFSSFENSISWGAAYLTRMVWAYSHLSFAFAACFVCHCMFEGESLLPRFNGFT
jgi:hypothetical protein